MKVKEVADLVGISVRTLHHYDEIGLLTPDGATEAGYRLYSDHNLMALQQILFFRALGFPLKKIKTIMSSPTFDKDEALRQHRSMLVDKRKQLDQLIRTLDKTIQHVRGEIIMTNKEKFKGFDFSHHPYEQEARERWGDQAVDRANAKAASFGAEKQEQFNEIYRQLAAIRHQGPGSEEAQAGIHIWYTFLNEFGTYSMEMFKNLGEMYVADERFTNNIDQFGEGLAAFMRDAMAYYADHHQ